MNVFPVVPYLITIETLFGGVDMAFESTEWHLPAKVTLTGSDAAVKALRYHFDRFPCGMWGYPIERLEFCSPMDIHANLTASNDVNIQKFDVIGYVPDELPASIHPDSNDPDDDEEERETE